MKRAESAEGAIQKFLVSSLKRRGWQRVREGEREIDDTALPDGHKRKSVEKKSETIKQRE